MENDFPFRFTVESLPEGEALTGLEIEENLIRKFRDAGGTCVHTLWSLARIYQATGYLDRASSCVHRVIELSKDLEELGSAHLALGQLEESRGDFSAATSRYRAALAMEPCSTETWYLIHNNLGYSLIQVGDYHSAMPYLRQAITIDPQRPNAYKNLGLVCQAIGEPQQAAEMFIAATRVNASDPRSLTHLTALLEAHPALEVDMPDLRVQIENCRKAVDFAKSQQPDFVAQWNKLRSNQERKWWQFWKKR